MVLDTLASRLRELLLRSVRVGTIVDLGTRDSRPREILVDKATAKKSGEDESQRRATRDESQRRATGDEGKTTSVHSKVGRGLREWLTREETRDAIPGRSSLENTRYRRQGLYT